MILKNGYIYIDGSKYKFKEFYMNNTLVEHPWGKQHGVLILKGLPEKEDQ
jgi:hypothetical protein